MHTHTQHRFPARRVRVVCRGANSAGVHANAASLAPTVLVSFDEHKEARLERRLRVGWRLIATRKRRHPLRLFRLLQPLFSLICTHPDTLLFSHSAALLLLQGTSLGGGTHRRRRRAILWVGDRAHGFYADDPAKVDACMHTTPKRSRQQGDHRKLKKNPGFYAPLAQPSW